MPDITMCRGEKCPLKEICYRHTAKPDRYQSYFAQSPVLGGTCKYFWRAEPKKCKYVKRTGEGCTLNNNCKYPNCE